MPSGRERPSAKIMAETPSIIVMPSRPARIVLTGWSK
jgi:hypothetical protein